VNSAGTYLLLELKFEPVHFIDPRLAILGCIDNLSQSETTRHRKLPIVNVPNMYIQMAHIRVENTQASQPTLRAFTIHFPPNFHHGFEKKTGSRIRRYISGCTFFNPMSVQAPYSPQRALQQSKQLKLVPFPNVEVNSDVMMSDAEPMYPDVSHSRLQSNASSISSNTSDSPVTQSRM
jgi:hypothetical protein